jgi:hypothetical protein
MRKLRLLLSAGAMLGLAAGAAYAENFPPNNPGVVANPTGVGMLTLPSGFTEVGSVYTGGMGLEGETASPASVAAPGTVNMRVNLFAVGFGQVGSWTGQNGSGTGTANKEDPYGILGWMRIDMGIDGMTKGGVEYGAFAEIRENSAGVVSGLSAVSASATSQNSSTLDSQNTLYVRHLWVYLGTPQLGILRIGQGTGANAVLWVGGNDEFGFGGWVNSATLSPTTVVPTWPWPDSGNEYMAQRLVYIAPLIAGFDGSISFAPNNDTGYSASPCGATYTGCISQSSSDAAGDQPRYRNQLEIGLRYHNAFGPIGVAMSGIWTHSGVVGIAAGTTPTAHPVGIQRYNGQNIAMIGAEISINHSLAIGANTMFGAFNGSWGLQAQPSCYSAGVCDTTATTAVAWVAGARYTFLSLPLTVGGNYFNYKYQGQVGLPTQRTSQGIELGADWGIGPGIALVAEYDWGQNYQGDYNFLAGAVGGANNKVTINQALLGAAVRF